MWFIIIFCVTYSCGEKIGLGYIFCVRICFSKDNIYPFGNQAGCKDSTFPTIIEI